MGEAIRENAPYDPANAVSAVSEEIPTEPSPKESPSLSFTVGAAVVVFAATLTVLTIAKPVFFPIVLAMLCNLLLSPSVRALHRVGLPNPVGAVLVLAAAFCAIGFAVSRLLVPAALWFEQLPRRIAQLESKLRVLTAPIAELSEAGERLAEAADLSNQQGPIVRVQGPATADALLTVTGSVLAQLLVAIVLLYFFLSGGDRFLSKSVGVMPRLKDKKKVVEIGRSIERSLSVYLLSVAGINVALGCSIAAAMWLLGMPNAALWGMMAAVVNFVPYLGSITGLAVVTVVSLTTFDNPFYALTVTGVYFLLDTLEGAVLTPLVLGYQFDLSPPIILMWLLLWGWLWGIAGVLLAVPMLTAIKILCDHVPSLAPLATFLAK